MNGPAVWPRALVAGESSSANVAGGAPICAWYRSTVDARVFTSIRAFTRVAPAATGLCIATTTITITNRMRRTSPPINAKPVTLNNPLNNPDFRRGASGDGPSNSPPIEVPFRGPRLPQVMLRMHLPLPCAVTPVNESFKIETRLANRPSGPRCRAPFYSHARNS